MSQDRVTCAPHIRGVVRPHHFGGERIGWEMHVINTTRGTRLAGDNGYGTVWDALADCERVVGAARVAWMRGFGKGVT